MNCAEDSLEDEVDFLVVTGDEDTNGRIVRMFRSDFRAGGMGELRGDDVVWYMLEINAVPPADVPDLEETK